MKLTIWIVRCELLFHFIGSNGIKQYWSVAELIRFLHFIKITFWIIASVTENNGLWVRCSSMWNMRVHWNIIVFNDKREQKYIIYGNYCYFLLWIKYDGALHSKWWLGLWRSFFFSPLFQDWEYEELSSILFETLCGKVYSMVKMSFIYSVTSF